MTDDRRCPGLPYSAISYLCSWALGRPVGTGQPGRPDRLQALSWCHCGCMLSWHAGPAVRSCLVQTLAIQEMPTAGVRCAAALQAC